MSESDEERPLSRRERRLRDLAETGIVPVVEEAPVAEPAPAISQEEPEIALFNPDGTARSRREIRELREQALAEMRVLEEPEAAPEVDAPHPADQDPAGEAESGSHAEAGELDLESTQAFSLQDLEEAIAAGERSRSQEGSAAEPLDDNSVARAEAEAVSEPEFEVVEGQPGGPQTIEADIIDEAVPLEGGDGDRGCAAVPASGSEDSTGAEPAGPESDTDAAPQPAPAYSFPDIAPLDEGGSVFDDPALRLAGAGGAQGDFDSLISRAVAQEGAASSTNSSALILPDLGHTGQLSGPLGETGELFITGSIDLPKSLGETGGHASLLDSVQGDPDEFAMGVAPSAEATGIIAPVSASRAVSARSTSAAVVAAPEKEKRQLPIALIATGGGLLVVVAGLAIWAASTGFFA